MKYGGFKYSEAKYGAAIGAGSGDISPSGTLTYLKVFLRNVGEGGSLYI